MKKQLLWLSTLGGAAGFLYALGSKLRQQNGNGKTANGESVRESKPSAKRKGHTASRANASNSKRANGRLASMAKVKNGKAGADTQPTIDDQGTDQITAAQILKDIRDNAFDSSDEKLALALGRPAEEIEEWTSGHGMIDGDVIMKARVLAMQRGVEGE